jgi:putative endonuclease
MPDWCVYLLSCADGTIYCGISNDLVRRLAAHRQGSGAKYTRSRRPVTLLGSVPGLSQAEALRLELAVKRRPPGRKLAFLLSHARPADPEQDLGLGNCQDE